MTEAYRRAGFHNVVTETIAAPVRMTPAAECLQFEQDSFGALHQMMSGHSDTERAETWAEIAAELRQFEGPDGFEGPCEMTVGIGVK